MGYVAAITRPKITSISNNNKSFSYFSINTSDYKQIILDGFEHVFKLNLKSQHNDEFLSPNLVYFNKFNKYSLKSSDFNDAQKKLNNAHFQIKSDCFYNGHINDDPTSFAYINLCHDGHIVRKFSFLFRLRVS